MEEIVRSPEPTDPERGGPPSPDLAEQLAADRRRADAILARARGPLDDHQSERPGHSELFLGSMEQTGGQ